MTGAVDNEGIDPGTGANRGFTERATQGVRATTLNAPNPRQTSKDRLVVCFVTSSRFEITIPSDYYGISRHRAEEDPTATGEFAAVGSRQSPESIRQHHTQQIGDPRRI